MSIRTTDELQEAMAGELAWRRKELHGLKLLVIANKATHSRNVFVCAALTLLYAHWEGFVRQIGSYYLEFVARRQLKHSELSKSFMAMAVSKKMRDSGGAGKIEPWLDVVDFFRSHSEDRSNIGWKSGIDTKSNLSASVFREIVMSLGLDYRWFETKEKLIDKKLLENRNKIAHGQYSLVGYDEYLELHDAILGIMQDFYNQVDNAANTSTYRAQPAASD